MKHVRQEGNALAEDLEITCDFSVDAEPGMTMTRRRYPHRFRNWSSV